MKFEEFKIGEVFSFSGRQWLCTDLGTRTVVCIRLGEHNMESHNRETGETKKYVKEVKLGSSWLDGPPYALVEHVLDEYEWPHCTKVIK